MISSSESLLCVCVCVYAGFTMLSVVPGVLLLGRLAISILCTVAEGIDSEWSYYIF
jgi:hypothetical protein